MLVCCSNLNLKFEQLNMMNKWKCIVCLVSHLCVYRIFELQCVCVSVPVCWFAGTVCFDSSSSSSHNMKHTLKHITFEFMISLNMSVYFSIFLKIIFQQSASEWILPLNICLTLALDGHGRGFSKESTYNNTIAVHI